jgi:predicted transcriptional regulator
MAFMTKNNISFVSLCGYSVGEDLFAYYRDRSEKITET